MSELTFVKVDEPEHIAELANFAGDIFEEYFSQILPQNKVDYLVQYLLGTETITREIADEDYEYYFADADGAHVGFVAVAPKDDHLYLSKLYLTKGNRGKGYGRQELQFVKQRARAHGLDKIRLNCARENIASLDRYDHLGFKKVKKVDAQVGEGIQMNDYVLEYDLPGASEDPAQA